MSLTEILGVKTVNDLISRESIRKPIYAEEDNITGQGMTIDEIEAYNRGIDDMYERIKKAPTVEATEVIHAHWIWDNNEEVWKCSNCASGDDFLINEFCENCGAKMDEVEE